MILVGKRVLNSCREHCALIGNNRQDLISWEHCTLIVDNRQDLVGWKHCRLSPTRAQCSQLNRSCRLSPMRAQCSQPTRSSRLSTTKAQCSRQLFNTLFPQKIISTRLNPESDFFQLNVLSQYCGWYGGRGMAKNMFSAWKQLIQTLFPTNNISTRLNPMQNLILSMECSFSALWLLWGPRNGQKPVFSLNTAISHSFPHQ